MRLTKIFFLLLIILFLTDCQSDTNQSRTTTTEAQAIAVTWKLVKNDVDESGNNFQFAAFTLKNEGKTTLTNNWTLYFSQLNGPISGKTTTGNTEFTHINGDFYKLEPSENFNLPAGERVVIQYKGAYWATKSSDGPIGLYAVYKKEDGTETTPQPIKDYIIAPFIADEQLHRAPTDKFPIPTNQYRYNQNTKLTKLPKTDLLPVIPTPIKVSKGKGTLGLNNDFVINYFGDLKGEADYLTAELEGLGLNIKAIAAGAIGNKSIALSTVSTPIAGKKTEAYRLKVDGENEIISIEGTDAAGVFYGLQSLLALIPNDAYKQKNKAITFEELTIEDAPRFEYRGLMLDVARNFHSKKLVKKLLDLMASYKLNKFHFHITDDEGWRLEIPGLPELTEIGSKRGHTIDESDRLQPSYGSGASTEAIGYAGSGYFTTEDYIEIIKYAGERHIEVIPEIDLPGHARAAIVSMNARHKKLMAAGKTAEANQYLLNDPNDASEYRTAQNYNDNVVNVCRPSTYAFIEKVVDEVIALHKKAGVKLTSIHTGGDEVPKGAWQQSPICQALVANNPKIESDEIGMTNYFLKNINSIFEERNLIVAGWEEIALKLAGHGAPRRPNPEFVKSNFVPYIWNSIFGWGGEDIAYQLANLGYKVVLCNASNLYFDLAYDKDPENAGLYWAGYVNTRTAYDFVPFDLFKTAEMGRYGEKLDRKAMAAGKTKLNPKAQENVIGIQGQLWSEVLVAPERLEAATFPKLLGLAERAWAVQPTWATNPNETQRFANLGKDWNQFTNTIGQKEMTRLDYLTGGVGYYIPPAGAKIEEGKLYANTGFPGLSIRYTLDGSEPTEQSLEYSAPVEVAGDVRLKVFSGGGNASRSVLVKKELVD